MRRERWRSVDFRMEREDWRVERGMEVSEKEGRKS